MKTRASNASGRWRKGKKTCSECQCDLNIMEDENAALGNEIMEMQSARRKGWMKIEVAVDSAAVDSVISEATIPGVRVRPSKRSKEGRHYVAANNQTVENEGEIVEQFTMQDGNKKWVHKFINFQIAKVGRPLLSVDKLIQAGNQVNLRKWNPYILTKDGQTIPLTRKNGVFIVTLWVKPPELGFSGQGR